MPPKPRKISTTSKTTAKKTSRKPPKAKPKGNKRANKTATPDHATPPPPPLLTGPLPTLILDTGGWTIKHATLFPPSKKQLDNESNTIDNRGITAPTHSPNVLAKPKHQLTTLLSSQINTVQQKSQLFVTRPIERGYTTDLGTQLQIWDYILQLENLNAQHSFSNGGAIGAMPTVALQKKRKAPNDVGDDGNESFTFTHTASIFCLSQPCTPRSILEREDEVWFRDFGFGRVARRLGASCSAYKYLQEGNSKRDNTHADIHSGIHTSIHSGTSTNGIDIEWEDDDTGCCCVVDCGFSMTSVVPTCKTMAIQKGIRRINIGGKLLTNLLKQTVSYRKFNMMDEFFIINAAKEALCFVSMDFQQEMKNARYLRQGCRWFDREFVLPNYVDTFHGSVRLPAMLQHLQELEQDNAQNSNDEKKLSEPNIAGGISENQNKKDDKPLLEGEEENSEDSDDETEDQATQRILKLKEEDRRRQEQEEMDRQALPLSVERFAIPEVLFRPSDIGIEQLGIAETIVQSIEACESMYRPALYQNIVLTGGSAKIPNIKARLEQDLRGLAPSNVNIRIYLPKDPDLYAWEGAKELVHDNGLKGSNIYLDRTEWEAKKESGQSAGDIWESVLNKDVPTSGLTFI